MRTLLIAFVVLGVVFSSSIVNAAIIGTDPVILTGGLKYNVSDGNLWYVTFSGINLEYDGVNNQKLNLVFGDNSSGYENFPIQIHEDFYGEGGHLLQAYDKWWGGPISSHGFNEGAIFGAFDIRVGLLQNPDGTWLLDPQYLIPTGSGNAVDGSIGGLDVWHTFYDGPYTSAEMFDLTVLEAWAQIDPSSSGQVSIQSASVIQVNGNGNGAPIPEPSTVLLLASGLVGIVAFRKKSMKT